MILIKRAAPPGELGRVNGATLFVQSLARAIAPAFVRCVLPPRSLFSCFHRMGG
jgi:hypothetical protein